jgi:hypothetical protein
MTEQIQDDLPRFIMHYKYHRADALRLDSIFKNRCKHVYNSDNACNLKYLNINKIT